MLESRVDQITQFEDKIEQVNTDVNKLKGMTNDFQKKFIKELGQTNTENASIRTQFERHYEDYKSQHMNAVFQQDKNESWQKNINKQLEQ